MAAADPSATPPLVPSSPPAPTKLKLKRDEGLTIDWSDGQQTRYTIAQLRRACPCATCKTLREQMSKSRLTVLPVTSSAATGPLSVTSAELVGNYALRVVWSDGHDKGIYSFSFLRELAQA